MQHSDFRLDASNNTLLKCADRADFSIIIFEKEEVKKDYSKPLFHAGNIRPTPLRRNMLKLMNSYTEKTKLNAILISFTCFIET